MKSMIFQITPIVVLSLVLGLTVATFRINLGPSSKISKLQSLPRNSDGDGIVPGTRSCGGPGKFIQWRYETCRAEDNPCHVPADRKMKLAEFDFIASKNINSIGLRFIVQSLDGEINNEFDFSGPIANSAVSEGEAYTISCVGGVTEELKGKPAKFQWIIYDKFNNETEICRESDLQYI